MENLVADTSAPHILPGIRRPEEDASPAGYPVTAKIVSGIDALHAHLWEWRDLAAAARGVTVFQTPEFIELWIATFLADNPAQLKTALIYDKGNLAALVPLVVGRKGPLRTARLAGFPIAQYDDLLIRPTCNPQAVLSALGKAVAADIGAQVLLLNNVRQDSILSDILKTGAIAIGKPGLAPVANFTDGNIGAFTASLKKKVRKQLAKHRRDMEAIGPLTFSVAETPEQAASWMDDALKLKRLWLHTTGRVSRAFMDQRTDNCLIAMAKGLSGAPGPMRCVMSRLTVAGQSAAYEFGFIHRKTYHAYLGAFAPEFSRHSPGNLLTESLISRLAEGGIGRYDMLAPESRYKREWASSSVAVRNYALALSATGRIYLGIMHQTVIPAGRWLFYRMPKPLRAGLARLLVNS